MKMIDTLSVKGRRKDACPFNIKQNALETKVSIISYHHRINKVIHIKEIISLMKSNGLLPERKPKVYSSFMRTRHEL